MTEKNQWRKPSKEILLATIAGVFFLSSLGVWQLMRGEEKKQILHEIESRKNSTPQAFNLPISDPTSMRYQRISAQGRFISDMQFVLDNRYLNHQVGFHILTPFQLSDSKEVVLVNRGWLPLKQSRDELPNIEVDEKLRTLLGSVYVPYGKAFSIGEIDTSTSWPRLIQFLDFDLLSDMLGQDLLPLTLRLDPGQSDSYKIQWLTKKPTPNRNWGYAAQWFAMALTVLIIFIVMHRPKSNTE